MVPPPSSLHETVATELMFALKPIADRMGLVVRMATSGLFGSEKNYRIPDVLLARPHHMSERGFEAAEVVVEVLSPNDESRDKFAFYASRGVREVWICWPRARTRATIRDRPCWTSSS